jgi:hypothetical protein
MTEEFEEGLPVMYDGVTVIRQIVSEWSARLPTQHATSVAKIVDSIRFDAFTVSRIPLPAKKKEKKKRKNSLGGGWKIGISAFSPNASARTSECGAKSPLNANANGQLRLRSRCAHAATDP